MQAVRPARVVGVRRVPLLDDLPARVLLQEQPVRLLHDRPRRVVDEDERLVGEQRLDGGEREVVRQQRVLAVVEVDPDGAIECAGAHHELEAVTLEQRDVGVPGVGLEVRHEFATRELSRHAELHEVLHRDERLVAVALHGGADRATLERADLEVGLVGGHRRGGMVEDGELVGRGVPRDLVAQGRPTRVDRVRRRGLTGEQGRQVAEEGRGVHGVPSVVRVERCARVPRGNR